MKRNELRNLRAQRDHRFNIRWWCLFYLGCLAAFVSTAAADGFTSTPWVILGGLVGMIAGRRQHARRVAGANALADAQAARAEAADWPRVYPSRATARRRSAFCPPCLANAKPLAVYLRHAAASFTGKPGGDP